MDEINQEQAKEIDSQIDLTYTWVNIHLERGRGKQLITAALNDLRIQVKSGEVPDYIGM